MPTQHAYVLTPLSSTRGQTIQRQQRHWDRSHAGKEVRQQRGVREAKRENRAGDVPGESPSHDRHLRSISGQSGRASGDQLHTVKADLIGDNCDLSRRARRRQALVMSVHGGATVCNGFVTWIRTFSSLQCLRYASPPRCNTKLGVTVLRWLVDASLIHHRGGAK